MNRGLIKAGVALVAALVGCGGAWGATTPEGRAVVQQTDACDVDVGAPGFNRRAFTPRVDHPLVPLTSIRRKVFEGTELDPETGEVIELRMVQRVLRRTARVAGVRVAVVEVHHYENGELVEHTLDYFAQHRRTGDVCYFGERVDVFENGVLIGHEGEWLAGQDGARPGLFMPANPQLGLVFEQERAPGIAEDISTIVAVDLVVTVPAGTFSGCISTEDVNPLGGVVEFKYYCPGVGLVREEAPGTLLDLVSYQAVGGDDDDDDEEEDDDTAAA